MIDIAQVDAAPVLVTAIPATAPELDVALKVTAPAVASPILLLLIFKAVTTPFVCCCIPVKPPDVAVVVKPRIVLLFIFNVPGATAVKIPSIKDEVAEAPVTAQFSILFELQLNVAVLNAVSPCKLIPHIWLVVGAFDKVTVLLL